MPEGPEIRRAADNLEAAIKGKPLTDVWFAFAQLKPYESQLTGQLVTRIEDAGKSVIDPLFKWPDALQPQPTLWRMAGDRYW